MWRKWLGKQPDKINDELWNQINKERLPRHIAIIMDGNGRWAQSRGLPRTFGHQAGVEALRDIVKCASELGVGALTAYAFSTENWKRPAEEVKFLMKLFSRYLDSEIDELNRNNVRIRFIGDIGALEHELQDKMEKAQQATKDNTGLALSLAVNYGGRAELLRAMRLIAEEVKVGRLSPDAISEAVVGQHLYNADIPDPDLLIRPSGDQRISNFLLWQAAYAEFWFTSLNWPDFKPEHLIEAILDYQGRERRFGGLKK